MRRFLGNTRPFWPYRLYHRNPIISLQDTFSTRMSQKCFECAPFGAWAEYIDQKNGRGDNQQNRLRRHPEEDAR